MTYDHWKTTNPADEELGPEPSFVCPRCGAESFNPNDIRERYCGRCHVFVDDEDEMVEAGR